MGWAKYREDIVSRWVNDNRDRVRRPQPAKRPALASTADTNRALASRRERIVSKLKEFTMASARPLPVIVLADVSGSMSANGKIEVLNDAVAQMIATFAEEDSARAVIHVAVIAFGGNGATLHKPLQPAHEARWEPMKAAGRTPMGGAFSLARELIDDRKVIPSRAYRPTLVLVSDGMSTDEWIGPLNELLQSERASKAVRFAMGIGADADHETLTSFLGNDEGRVFEAHEARQIRNFFQWVTMSVATRSASANPNEPVALDPTDIDDFDF